MKSKDFYQKIQEYIEKVNREEMINFISNFIRKVPESKYEEILQMIDTKKVDISEAEINKKIESYKEKFKEIEQENLYFYANQYEDYSYGWDNWVVEYSDQDNLGGLIDDVVMYAVDLVNLKMYKYAKVLFDMVINTNYQALDDEMGEMLEVSLVDMKSNALISINIDTLCLYIVYVTYQTSKNKVKDIYEYFKNYHDFINISIEDSFKLGVEPLEGVDAFFDDWISYLSETEGYLECRLLKEALDYTNYKGYTQYIDNITKNHPEIYIEIFKYLEWEDRKCELKELGDKVLKNIDKNSEEGDKIALYLANIDESNKETYICDAFMFNPNVTNLLRIVNNGYYKNHELEIREKIERIFKPGTDVLDNNRYYFYLLFFSGNFEDFYEETIKRKDLLGWSRSFEGTSVYLWLLLLSKNNETKCYLKALSQTFDNIGYDEKESLFLGDEPSEVWNEWQSKFDLDESLKKKIIIWLRNRIEDRVDAIMNGNYRKAYDRAALLVVLYGEMLESQDLEDKKSYVDYYLHKYSRRTAFISELNDLM